MIGILIWVAFIIPLLGVYGAMAGFTIQLARHHGLDDEDSVVAGWAWPLGLPFAVLFGKNREMAEQTRQQRRVAQMSPAGRREEELAEQQHQTLMATLKAREAAALEKAVRPTYQAIEEPKEDREPTVEEQTLMAALKAKEAEVPQRRLH